MSSAEDWSFIYSDYGEQNVGYGNYLSYAPSNTRSGWTTFDLTVPTTAYTIEFDASIAPGANVTDKETDIYIATGDILTTDNSTYGSAATTYLLRLAGGANGVNNTTTKSEEFIWALNDAVESKVTLKEGTFYHYKLVVNPTASTVLLTMTTDAGVAVTTTADTPVAVTDISLTKAGDSYVATYFKLFTEQKGRDHLLLDNILVYNN